jgi:3-hydroxymyristoyl/3-hydroxydecanoyl-(acyl carrier protein) dehydratase
LLDAQIGLAMTVAAEATHWPTGTKTALSRMTHVKMRSFIPPGAVVDIDAELAPSGAESATIRLAARVDGKTAATARLEVIAKAARP